jgi:hypothetical protein
MCVDIVHPFLGAWWESYGFTALSYYPLYKWLARHVNLVNAQIEDYTSINPHGTTLIDNIT